MTTHFGYNLINYWELQSPTYLREPRANCSDLRVHVTPDLLQPFRVGFERA